MKIKVIFLIILIILYVFWLIGCGITTKLIFSEEIKKQRKPIEIVSMKYFLILIWIIFALTIIRLALAAFGIKISAKYQL